MAHLSIVGEGPSGRVDLPSRRQGEDAGRPTRPVVREVDSAEFSGRARLAAGTVRQDLVEQVRRQIETGRYATAEKLEVAADRLARDLDLTA